MKKLFALLLAMALIVSCFTAQTVFAVKPATVDSPMTLFPYDSPEQETLEIIRQIADAELSSTKPAVPDGKLTLDIIENWSGSWKEFVNYSIPINLIYSDIENVEDQYCVTLIKGISHTMTIPIYHDYEYVKFGMGGLRVQEVELSRLLYKFRAIIELYNNTNEFDLVWQPKMLSEEIMQVDIESTNVEWGEHPAHTIGEAVQVKQGAKYWESSWNGGSGKYGIVTDGNPYFAEGAVLRVNGVSYLDDGWTNVLSSYYCPYNKLDEDATQIHFSRRMLLLCSGTTDLGWFYAEDVARLY